MILSGNGARFHETYFAKDFVPDYITIWEGVNSFPFDLEFTTQRITKIFEKTYEL